MTTVKTFDPNEHIIKLKGKDYIEVKWRLVWLRNEHPDASIVTEMLRYDDREAVFHALVSIPGGGTGSGHGSETPADFGDYCEKAETKAIGRALGALGYGTQFVDEHEMGEGAARRVVDSPVQRPVQRPAAQPTPGPMPEPPSEAPGSLLATGDQLATITSQIRARQWTAGQVKRTLFGLYGVNDVAALTASNANRFSDFLEVGGTPPAGGAH